MKVRTKSKSASKKKIQVNTSIKCHPSFFFFEIVQFGQVSTSLITWIFKRNTDRLKGYDTYFPPQIQPFMHSIVNVKLYRHYGFRAIIGLLGMSMHNWRDIHFSLIGEFQSFRAMYTQLYGSDMRVDEFLHILYCFDDIA